MTDPVKEYKDLNESWNISAVIKDIKNSYDAEVISDLFRISASLITTIESQNEEIEKWKLSSERWEKQALISNSEIKSLKAITELAMKGFQMLKAMSSKDDIPPALYNSASWYLDEIARLQNAQT